MLGSISARIYIANIQIQYVICAPVWEKSITGFVWNISQPSQLGLLIEDQARKRRGRLKVSHVMVSHTNCDLRDR